jgi:hypothetical protein
LMLCAAAPGESIRLREQDRALATVAQKLL